MENNEVVHHRLLHAVKKFVCTSIVLLTSMSAYANPEGGVISAGSASISYGNTTTINQTSDRAVIDWRKFNIAPGETTQFIQPSASSATLNRVNAAYGASNILGTLKANGQVFILNQAGVVFGSGAQVDVAGLVASTANITNHNFMNKNYQFEIPRNADGSEIAQGSIINQGNIAAKANGLVALLAPNVENHGVIQANLGHVILGSGKASTLDLHGDGLVNFKINTAADNKGEKVGVTNTGTIFADGGKILVSAQVAMGVVDQVINMQGVAQARSVAQHNGEIILSGGNKGTIKVAGKLDASGKQYAQKGGKVKVLGEKVALVDNANIDVSGHAGGGEVLIGGDYQGKNPAIQNAQHTLVDQNVVINADALSAGNGGKVIVWSDVDTYFHGNISARGGAQSGNGGFVETSGLDYLNIASAKVNLLASYGKTGTWLLDPSNLIICTDCTTTASRSGNTYNPDSSDSDLLVTDLTNALASANILVQTTSSGSDRGEGDIFVNAPITWSSANSLTLSAYHNIRVAAHIDITNTGGASVSLIANNAGAFDNGTDGKVVFGPGAKVALSGGSGTVSIFYNPTIFGTQDSLPYSSGTTPTRYMLINSLGQATDSSGTTNTRSLATVSNSPSYRDQNFALAADIDASATSSWNSGAGFSPIGNFDDGAHFGDFDGQNHTISNLTINQTDKDSVGFFGVAVGSIQNITLANVAITNTFTSAYDGRGHTGGLVGEYYGTNISRANISSGTIQVTSDFTGNSTLTLGGLVGYWRQGGIVSHSSNAANVVYNNTTGDDRVALGVGGLIGRIEPMEMENVTINNSYNSGQITVGQNAMGIGGLIGNIVVSVSNSTITLTNSYNTRNLQLSGTNIFAVGGLVGGFQMEDFHGISFASISDSYNTGSIVSTSSSSVIGGLVGYAFNIDSPQNDTIMIENSYSAGLMDLGSSTGVGGLMAAKIGNVVVNNSYWDADVSGIATSAGGGTALNTTQAALTQSSYSGWDFADTWGIIDGKSYPYLKAFHATTPRALSGTAYSDSAGTTPIINGTINLVANGTQVSTINTGNNGFFYFLFPNGTLADNTPLLVYIDGSTTKGNVVTKAPSSGGSLTGLNITDKKIYVAGTTTIANSDLLIAAGNLANTSIDILYAQNASGNNIRLGNAGNANVTLSTAADTTYNIDGTINSVIGGTVAINFGGAVTVDSTSVTTTGSQSYSGAVTANQLITSTVGGITLNNVANQINNFQATNSGSGNIVLTNTVPLTISGITQSGSGDIQITNNGSITISNSINGGAGTILLNNNYTGAIALNSTITTTNTTNSGNDAAITLVGSSFTNTAGALTTGAGGRYLVWSGNDPAGDNRTGLSYSFKQYNINYASPAVQTTTTGNGFLYTAAPTITPSLTGTISKIYDGINTATLVANNYTQSGAIDGDTVTLNNPTSGTYNNQHAGTGKALTVANSTITSATDSAVKIIYGYTVAATTNLTIGAITPKQLTVQLTNTGVTKVYDGTNAASFTPTYNISGFITGDTSATLNATSQTFKATDVTTANFVNANGLTISSISGNQNSLASDYSLSSSTASSAANSASITPASLIITADDKTKTYGQTMTFTGHEFTSSGLQNNETIGSVTLLSDGTAAAASVGTYDIIASNATNGTFDPTNYFITYNSGVLTIDPAPPTPSITPADKEIIANIQNSYLGLINTSGSTVQKNDLRTFTQGTAAINITLQTADTYQAQSFESSPRLGSCRDARAGGVCLDISY